MAAGARDLLSEAMAMHREGRLAEADALYERGLRLEPDNAQALRLRGILARERDDLVASVELLKQSVTVAPDDPGASSELALSQMASGDLQAAEASFRRALAGDPDWRKALANLGALLQRRGHLREAISFHRRYLELEPADLEVRCNLANTLMEAGSGNEALEECERALAIQPNHPVVLANQGAVLCGLEQFGRAVDVLERAVARDPGDELALINLGYAHSQLEQGDAAISALRNAVRISPDHARAVADLAGALMAAGRTAESIELCEHFLARHPGERLVVATYAFALRDGGRDVEARAILNYDELIQVFDLDVPPGYDSLSDFNNAIATFIQTHPSIVTDPVSKATTEGNQTGEIYLDATQELVAFASLIDGALSDAVTRLRSQGFSDHPVMACAADFWTYRVWGVVLGAGGRQVPHLHPLGWLSGVYYARLPADMGSAGPEAGWLEFGAPPARLKTETDPVLKTVEPREGRLILFPSYLYHQTRPFESDEPRISISFDVVPQAR